MTTVAPILRFVLIGDSSVGKSSVLARFVDDQFNPSFYTTVGIDFKIKTVVLRPSGKEVKLQIWDTGGQERFRTITRAYYRGASAIILVYDITARESFRHLDDWYAQIQQETEELPRQPIKVLVGNKLDLIRDRVITREEGEAWAKAHDYLFTETSAVHSTGIADMFLDLADRVYFRPAPALELGNESQPAVIRLDEYPPGEEKEKKSSCC